VSTPRSLRLPPQVRPTRIKTRRGRFAALVAQPRPGVCERQPALLVPGLTGSKEDFLAVLEPLAAPGRTVIAVDMRGQYESPAAHDRDGYAAAELAADVIALAGEIGLRAAGAHLLGHSYGGLITRQAVLTDRSRVTSLTLLGSGPGTLAGQRAAALRRLLAVLDPPARPATRDSEALVHQQLELWDTELLPRARQDGATAEVLEFLRARAAGTSPLGLAVMARQLLDFQDRTDELALCRLPVLVGYGENDDAWPPAEQDEMAIRLGAQRVCIPGAAHSPAVEAPETTAAMLTAFWNKAEDDARSARVALRASPGA
jgi:pimeloyl-ACP methyl ester carboxylesterase